MSAILTTRDIEPTFTLASAERRALQTTLSGISHHPYNEPEAFLEEVAACAMTTEIYARVATWMRETDLSAQPVLYLRNLPLEAELPVFGHDDPVDDKYRSKVSFLTEALLTLVAAAAGTPIVGYRSINNGDLFHDIYLKDSLKFTASQKSMVSFGFHYDMGFKRLRPDWANLACLRSSSANRVSTSVCRNVDLLDALSPEDLAVLAEPIYTTPPEVVSVDGGAPPAVTLPCPVRFTDRPWNFEYFEGRTTSDVPEGRQALARLGDACHRSKQYLILQPGELALISNNHSIHCREVLHVADLAAHRQRWLIKTYNVSTLRGRQDRLAPGFTRIADE